MFEKPQERRFLLKGIERRGQYSFRAEKIKSTGQQFIRRHGQRHPREMGKEEVEALLSMTETVANQPSVNR